MSDPMSDFATAAKAKDSRPIHVFKVPEKLAQQSGVKEVGLVELTGEEEVLATRRTKMEILRLASESAKESLRMVNGKPVNLIDGSTDKAWEAMGAMVRGLVIQAYGSIHQAKPEDAADFLKSHSVTVG